MGFAKINVPTETASASGGGITSTLPTVLASCSAASGNTKAEISWEYTDTDYVAGMRICYKTGGYPENAEDGAYVDIEGAETLSATITGLTNNLTYYFRLFPYNENGDYQAAVTNALCECTPTAITVVAGTATVETGITADGTTGYAIISSSGTFDIVASGEQEITAYLVGGGANGGTGGSGTLNDGLSGGGNGGSGGAGGYVTTLTVMSANGTVTDTATVAAVGSELGTKLTHNGTAYSYTSGTKLQRSGGTGTAWSWHSTYNPSGTYTAPTAGMDGIEIPGYGFVGSSGGGAGWYGQYDGEVGGEGAGNGGVYSGVTSKSVTGSAASNYGCGGGGNGGAGKQGCIILNWAL